MFKENETVRLNDSQSEYHKQKAKVVKVGENYYDIEIISTKTRMRVVPEQLMR